MRILLAAKTMGVGGLERIVVGLARELHSRDHQVWVVSSGGNLVDELQQRLGELGEAGEGDGAVVGSGVRGEIGAKTPKIFF